MTRVIQKGHILVIQYAPTNNLVKDYLLQIDT
jgi:hypothetical protein